MHFSNILTFGYWLCVVNGKINNPKKICCADLPEGGRRLTTNLETCSFTKVETKHAHPTHQANPSIKQIKVQTLFPSQDQQNLNYLFTPTI